MRVKKEFVACLELNPKSEPDLKPTDLSIRDDKTSARDLLQYARELRPRSRGSNASSSSRRDNLLSSLAERKNVKLIDMESPTRVKKFPCLVCSRRFSTKHGLAQHQKYECRQEPRFECAYCLYKCKRPWVIGEHVRRHHRDKPMQYLDNFATM